ncbi:hypothetical protein DFH08DRAFT_1086595 [Mycena albidolilacea]|uniref:Uncharacterized protein n=1 Tax=Mycena albidolilacea TaxID=1033008 RepID=A0AAD6ZDZ8_9AGAR|nr:hypothetical protein DFH08DRAFT_1086595 [Mycena albidolilacea]
MSLQPSALSGVEHDPADLFEHTTPAATRSVSRCSHRAVPEPTRFSPHASSSALFTASCSTTRLRLRITPPRAYTSHTSPCSPRSPRCTPDPARIQISHLCPCVCNGTDSSAYYHSYANAHAVVEPLPHGEVAFLSSAPHVHIISPVCRGYITPPARSPFVVQRAGATRVELAPAPDAPPRAFTTAESSTRNGDVEDDEDEFELGSEDEGDNAQSPPTSLEAEYDDEEAGSGAETAARHEGDGREEEDEEKEGEDEEDYHDTPAPHAWYKPSVPVLLALAPPIGNWLTRGDHVKDLLLLLLLVFYLHQIVEVPWFSTTPPAPRDASPIPIPALRARCAARAQSALRTLDLGLLLLCLITPLLGPAAPVPISWFSTALFDLTTALRPLRELVSRVVSRTSTLHSQVHAHSPRSSSSRDKNADAESTQAQLAALRAQVAHLELAVAQLAAPDWEDALYAYVEEALAPLEKGVRRVERRVGRLRAGRKELEGVSKDPIGSGSRILIVNFAACVLATLVSIVHAYFLLGPGGSFEGIAVQAQAATALLVANAGLRISSPPQVGRYRLHAVHV